MAFYEAENFAVIDLLHLFCAAKYKQPAEFVIFLAKAMGGIAGITANVIDPIRVVGQLDWF